MLASTAEAGTVERVGWLVQAAGATLKEKKRPIKVVGRDGAVKKTIPHVEVIEGLLHHEGISGALEEGLRPETIRCAVCRCVVKVKPKGSIPSACRKHRKYKLCSSGCGAAVKLSARQPCRACRATPTTIVQASRPCSACGRPIPPEQKRRQCVGCTVRKCRGSTVAGASCGVCGARDPRVLRRVRLADGPAVLCANEAAILGRRAITLAELRAETEAKTP